MTGHNDPAFVKHLDAFMTLITPFADEVDPRAASDSRQALLWALQVMVDQQAEIDRLRHDSQILEQLLTSFAR